MSRASLRALNTGSAPSPGCNRFRTITHSLCYTVLSVGIDISMTANCAIVAQRIYGSHISYYNELVYISSILSVPNKIVSCLSDWYVNPIAQTNQYCLISETREAVGTKYASRQIKSTVLAAIRLWVQRTRYLAKFGSTSPTFLSSSMPYRAQ